MVTLIQDVELRRIIAQLRPAVAYDWLGSKSKLQLNRYHFQLQTLTLAINAGDVINVQITIDSVLHPISIPVATAAPSNRFKLAAAEITITRFWATPASAGATSQVYMTIKNHSDAVINISSIVYENAATTELRKTLTLTTSEPQVTALAIAVGRTLIMNSHETWDSVVVWTDGETVKPTEAEMITQHDLNVITDAMNVIAEAGILTSVAAFTLTRTDAQVALALMADLTTTFLDGNTPNASTVYSAFVTRLVGTNLETPVKNYVTMMTGLTGFGVGIPDSEKQQIMTITLGFLHTLWIVWRS